MRSHVPFLSVVLLAAPAAAPAQEAELAPASLVVTGSRLATPAGETPYSVAVVPEAQLVGRESVADALSDLADVYVQAPGGRSGVAAIFLRGSDPNFTSVLLDGVPLNNPANPLGGSVNVSELSSAGIQRIELVAGPLSSLYGSGALAGVVNLVVPGGSPVHGGQARLGLGTAEDYSAFLRWRGPMARNYGGSLALTVDDSGDAAVSSRFRSQAIIGKLAPMDRPEAGRILFRLSRTEARAFPDSSGGPFLASIRELEERRSREGLIGVTQPLLSAGPIRLDVSASLFNRRDRTSSPGVAPSGADPVGVPGGEDETRYWRGAAQTSLRYETDGWQAVAGVETQREVARSAGELVFFGMAVPSGFRGDRWTHSGFVEASLASPAWVVNAGARIDRIDGLGARLTGRAGIRYRVPGSGLSFRAAAGTGFKAPSFYALGNPFVGNPELGPERSRSVEAGIEYDASGAASFSLTAFHSRFAGLVDFVPDPVPRLENRSVVISKGVSAALSTAVSDQLNASLQLHYADTTDRETGERLLNRPKWRSSSRLTWTPAPDVTLSGRHRYVGARRAFSVPTGITELSGYHDVSVEGAWRIAGGSLLRLVIDNLGDADQEDAVGFPAPGRRARLIVEQSF
jgi:outer membrane cobalamin receptor